jgi:hypothetical protein
MDDGIDSTSCGIRQMRSDAYKRKTSSSNPSVDGWSVEFPAGGEMTDHIVEHQRAGTESALGQGWKGRSDKQIGFSTDRSCKSRKRPRTMNVEKRW